MLHLVTLALVHNLVAAPIAKAKVAIAYPWAFSGGHAAAQSTCKSTVEEIAKKAGYAVLSSHGASVTWLRLGLPAVTAGHRPSGAQLEAFGKKVGARYVLFGDASWHTRSIWVGAGPKTISTAKVDAYVFDVSSGKTIFSKRKVEGRSDERESDLKLVADILLTPLVSAVSGGPATPREQRAVQIALSRAYHAYVVKSANVQSR